MTAPPIDKLPVPTSVAELEDMINDADLVGRLISNGQFSEVITAYSRAINERDSSISQQIQDEVQRVTAEWLRENALDGFRPQVSPDASKPADRKLYNPNAPGAKLDAVFENTADYMGSMYFRQRDGDKLAKAAKAQQIQNSFGSVVPADGGFLIPERLRAELLRVSLESAIVRPRARVIPMDSLRVPFPTIDATSNASNVYGGVTAYWTEEAAALTESQARFGRITLEAKKLTAYAEVPSELFTDSIISLGAFIDEIYPEAIAWFEDIAFLRGTGVGEPYGVFNSPAIVAVAAEAGQPAATIMWENIVTMYSRMLPASLGRAVWVAHINTFRELATMALSVGTGGSAIWLNNGVEGPPMTILGRPVIFTEKVSSVGTQGDISFIDFGYYLIGDRQIMTSMTSEHFKFSTDKVAMRFIERLDGRGWLQSAITPNQGSTTLSPFVQLATRP